jgi:hypothetical protein
MKYLPLLLLIFTSCQKCKVCALVDENGIVLQQKEYCQKQFFNNSSALVVKDSTIVQASIVCD